MAGRQILFCLKFSFMKFIGLVLLVSFLSLNGFSQDPYEVNWKTDGILVGTSALLLGADYAINADLEPLTMAEIDFLNKMDINGFDRWATEQYSGAAGHRSDVGLIGPAAGALSSLVIFPAVSQDKFMGQFGKLSLIWLETNLINYGLTDMAKSLTLRTRPFVYNPDASPGEKLEIDARKSFFSGHTSISSANSYFIAKVFSDYYPDSKWKPLVWTLAVTIPAWTGLERVLAGKHFPTDVITGYAVGALCGYFIPHFHLKERQSKLTAFPWVGQGYSGVGLVLNL